MLDLSPALLSFLSIVSPKQGHSGSLHLYSYLYIEYQGVLPGRKKTSNNFCMVCSKKVEFGHVCGGIFE